MVRVHPTVSRCVVSESVSKGACSSMCGMLVCPARCMWFVSNPPRLAVVSAQHERVKQFPLRVHGVTGIL